MKKVFKRIATVYSEFDKDCQQTLKQERVDCQAGCNHCCKQIVFVRPTEGLFLREKIDQLRFSNDFGERALGKEIETKIVDWIKIFWDWARGLGVTHRHVIAQEVGASEKSHLEWAISVLPLVLEHLKLEMACPILDLNGKCSLYDWRPGVCRSYFSLSESACKKWFKLIEPNLEIPRPGEGKFREKIDTEIFNIGIDIDEKGYKIPISFAVADPWRWVEPWKKADSRRIDWVEAPGDLEWVRKG